MALLQLCHSPACAFQLDRQPDMDGKLSRVTQNQTPMLFPSSPLQLCWDLGSFDDATQKLYFSHDKLSCITGEIQDDNATF